MANSTLIVGLRRKVTTVTTTYIIVVSDSVVFCDPTGGSFTVTLPTAVGINGKIITVKHSGSTNNITLNTQGGNIDGETTMTLSSKDSIDLISDGTNWQII
jgi:hypothetical protein